MEADDVRDAARRNLAIAEAMRGLGEAGDKIVLEGFMATFHPQKQRDRRYMNELHRASKRKEQHNG